MSKRSGTAYVAIEVCDHIVAAMADDMEDRRFMLRMLRSWKRDGLRVETRTNEEVQRGNWCPDTCTRMGTRVAPSVAREFSERVKQQTVPKRQVLCPKCRAGIAIEGGVCGRCNKVEVSA